MHLDTNKTKNKYFNKRRTFKKVLLINVLFYTFVFNWLFSDLIFVFKTESIFKSPISVKAAATNQVWNFSNAADYTLSDSSLIQVTSNKSQLKLRSQTSDANTVLLYNLDENTGTSATDSSSSSPANTGTIQNGSWEASNFNYAQTFNGTSSQISAPDTSSLSFTGNNTLEAQVKMGANFSAGSTYRKQGLFDKGSYKLYFDNETGKVVYELADSTATNWTQVAGSDLNGSWDLDGITNIDSITNFGGNLYVGGSGNTNDAEVWKWDGTTWTQIAGNSGINSSWALNTFEGVYSLANDGTNLYAGLGSGTGDGEVWKYNGSSWSKIGGDALNGSWALNLIEQVRSLNYYGGNLYAGTGTGAGEGDVWRYNGSTWTQIGGDTLNSSWASSTFEYVYSMANDGTNLYVGLGSTTLDAEVWRWNGSSWTKLGGDGLSSSWNTSFEIVTSLDYFGSSLYVGLGTGGSDAEVWRYTGTTWTKIGGGATAVNSSWSGASYDMVHSLTNDGTNLYAGLGDGAGDNEVYKWNGSTWTKIGGDGLNSGFNTNNNRVSFMTYYGGNLYAGLNTVGTYSAQVWKFNGTSWSYIGGDRVNQSWGIKALQSVDSMIDIGNYLYAGTGMTTAGNATVWRYDGTSWTMIGGQGLNSSWSGLTYESVMSMVSYKGTLYVGLGTSANDAEVWKWSGTTWSQVGGDSLKSGWTTNFDEVYSMVPFNGLLYVGLGSTATEAEVWAYSDVSDTWSKVGGDGVSSSWNTTYERVRSLAVYNNQLYAGVGDSTTESEVWRYNGTTWAQIGGDGLNSSWNTSYETVEIMYAYNGKLYAGLGNGTDDAEVWEYNGTAWTRIGGDGINGSWDAGTYERVKSLIAYNGELYAGIGNSTGDGKIYKWNGSTWTQMAGDSLNASWGSTIEEVIDMVVYKGKMYAAIGNTANTDASVWSYGDNGYLESTTSSFNSGTWFHLAATYDGSTMKIFINGVQDSNVSVSRTLPDNSYPLLIGALYGGGDNGSSQGTFNGSLDEIKISNTARSSFITTPFSASSQTVTVNSAVTNSSLQSFDSFSASTTLNGGTVKFRFSTDGGSSYKYWTGSAWQASTGLSDSSLASAVGSNISTIGITSQGLLWQAVLSGDGSQQVILNSVTLDYTTDTAAPDVNAHTVTLTNATDGQWTNQEPTISWTAGSDVAGGTGILGYCIALEEANVADSSSNLDPQLSAGSILNLLDDGVTSSACPYIVTGTSINLSTVSSFNLTSGKKYYFSIKAVDNSGNVYTGSSSNYQNLVSFKYDNTGPDNVDYLITPQRTFGNINDMYFSWPTVGGSAASDTGSELLGYQYQLNSTSDTGWKGTTPSVALGLDYIPTTDSTYDLTEGDDGANVVIGTNVVYFRAIDTLGNVSSNISGTLEYGGEAPTFAKECTDTSGITVTPGTSTSNNFALSWGAASAGGGTLDKYYYMINRQPPTSLDTLQSNSTIYIPTTETSVSAAVLPGSVKGSNTVYVVAVDDEGNYSSSNCLKGVYTLNSTLPDAVRNLSATDASIKSESLWRASVSWDEPTYKGTGELTYRIQRSTDNSTWSTVSTTTGLSYTETVPESTTYYYRVGVYDTTNNSRNAPTYSTSVDVLTKGSYDTAPDLSSDPKVSNITTKRATINWSTGRIADSKIAYGTKSRTYFDSEPSSSTQVTSHEILLNNLTPGTKYYYQAKWTDEDGNLGVSSEYTFTTSPAPSVSDVIAENISISSALIKFKSKNGETALLQFGESITYGGSETIGISNSESVYSIQLSGLKDNTTYHYRLILKDTEADSYEFEDHIFTTLPRPKIENVRIQQVPQAAQPTVLILWKTNTPITSVATYTSGADALKEVNLELSTLHKVILKNLKPNTKYSMVISGTDKAGNEATSDAQYFTTSTDTRPAEILNLEVKSIIKGVGDTATAQIVISWDTDEDTTSQVEYGQGTGTTYSQKSGEDRALVKNHTIILTNLSPSQVYHLRAVSKDSAGNITESIDTVTVTQKAVDSALDLVVQNLSEAFGFISKLK